VRPSTRSSFVPRVVSVRRNHLNRTPIRVSATSANMNSSGSAALNHLLMASPVGERDGQGKRPRCVGLIFLPAAALALMAMLAAGCGGAGDPGPKVEAGLQHYFSTFNPEDSVFPYAAGAPRLIDNGCKELHRKLPWPPADRVGLSQHADRRLTLPTKSMNVALWQCFVRFNAFTLTVHVALNDSNEVVSAWPVYGDERKRPKLAPARTYTG
jgi:hypothetical protein